MLKILTAGHQIPWGEPAIRVLHPGRTHGFEKSASETQKFIKGLKSEPGRTKVWLIAMGAGEFYGCNRNGDYFSANALRKHHPTFVAHGCVFKHHQNKDPSKASGKVIHSTYNEAMHRVELIVDLDNSKCAAEIAKLAAGEEVAVSMACRVPYDVCSTCGHRARHVGEYCDCLKNHMAEIYADGTQTYADNPEPDFFDISIVWKPADRIAYVLEKVASRGYSIIPSAIVAIEMGLTESPWQMNKRAQQKLAVLQKLSDIEKKIDSNFSAPGPQTPPEEVSRAMLGTETLGDDLTGELNKLPVKGVMSSLARNGICMDPQEFVKVIVGPVAESDEIAGTMMSRLPGIFSRLLGSKGLPEFLGDDSYDFEGFPEPPRLKGLLARLMEDRSLFKGPATKRLMQITILGGSPGVDSPARPAEQVKASQDRFGVADRLAKAYALYKVATLQSSEVCNRDPYFAELVVRQNYVACGRRGG